MKNKGRKHMTTSGNCKGMLVGITRPIESMGNRSNKFQYISSVSNKLRKKGWSKRVRGYLKTDKGRELFMDNY